MENEVRKRCLPPDVPHFLHRRALVAHLWTSHQFTSRDSCQPGHPDLGRGDSSHEAEIRVAHSLGLAARGENSLDRRDFTSGQLRGAHVRFIME